MHRLTTLFPSALLEERAEEFDVVERDSKLQVPAFVWSFVFGFAASDSQKICMIRGR
jgi:putative transposase